MGEQVAMQCVVDILLLLWWQMCAAAGRRGCACKRVCLFARCSRRPMYGVVLLFVTIAMAAADIWGLCFSALVWDYGLRVVVCCLSLCAAQSILEYARDYGLASAAVLEAWSYT